MAKYVYPAIFTLAEEGGYLVNFPSLENCFTDGDTLAEAFENAEDALALMMCTLEDKGTPEAPVGIPVEAPEHGEVHLIHCDTMEYRRLYQSRAIKKTLTIPAWLNTAAERHGINFSQVLQEALIARLEP